MEPSMLERESKEKTQGNPAISVLPHHYQTTSVELLFSSQRSSYTSFLLSFFFLLSLFTFRDKNAFLKKETR